MLKGANSIRLQRAVSFSSLLGVSGTQCVGTDQYVNTSHTTIITCNLYFYKSLLPGGMLISVKKICCVPNNFATIHNSASDITDLLTRS